MPSQNVGATNGNTYGTIHINVRDLIGQTDHDTFNHIVKHGFPDWTGASNQWSNIILNS